MRGCSTATRIPTTTARSSALAGHPGTLVGGAARRRARGRARASTCATERGQHPHVGAIDVVPIVHLDRRRAGRGVRGGAGRRRSAGDASCGFPCSSTASLAGGRTRAEIRRGGVANLATRMRDGELTPDFGPRRPHRSAGVTLVSARPPLVAFNVELAPPSHFGTAREIASAIREGGREGMPGLRAIAIELHTRERTAQVSMNVEDPHGLPLAAIVEAIGASRRRRRRGDRRARAARRARGLPGRRRDPRLRPRPPDHREPH